MEKFPHRSPAAEKKEETFVDGLSIEQRDHLREKDPDFYKIIDNVDFTFLRNSFGELAKHSGIEGGVNVVGPENIASRDVFFSKRMNRTTSYLTGGKGFRSRGQYHVPNNVIEIDWAVQEQLTSDVGMEWLRPFAVLKTLIHEETHAVSKRECAFPNENGTVAGYWQTGFHRAFEGPGTRPQGSTFLGLQEDKRMQKAAFHYLNEGVVEKLSQEIFSEYVKNAQDKNFTKEASVEFAKWHASHTELRSYTKQVKLVETFIKFVSVTAGVPEDVVWGGIVRSLFEGEKFEDNELIQMFQDDAGFDVLREIAYMQSDNISSIQDRLDTKIKTLTQTQQKQGAPSFKERIRAFFFQTTAR